MNKNPVIGLTGGIACGKTTVANMLQNLGACVIDADLMGHQILQDDINVKRQVIEAFGKGILDDNGQIDRPKLGRIVFDSPDQLELLNGIIHPPIIEAIDAEIVKKLTSKKCKAVVVDAALLIECNLTNIVDYVVLVHVEKGVQIQRLIERGLSKEDAQKRMASQMLFQEKRTFADFVIYNSGTLADTEKQINQVWNSMLKRICG